MTSRTGAAPLLRLAGAAAAWALTGGALAMVATVACDDCRLVAERPRDLALFAAWLAAVYGAAFAVAGLGAALLSSESWMRRFGAGAPLQAWVGAHATAAAIGAGVVAAGRQAAASLVPPGHPRVKWLVFSIAVLLAAAAVAIVLSTLIAFLRSRRRLAIALTLAFPLAGIGVLGVTLPTVGPAPPRVTSMPEVAARGEGPVLLFAVDGADWRRIDPLLVEDRLPNLAEVVARGVRAPLASSLPSYSAILWTTIATGAAESQHGVHGFTELRFPGLSCGVQRLPRWVLLRELVAVGARFDRFRIPVTACRVRSKPLWTILSEHSRRVAVVRWFATWPAAPVAGYLVSDRNPRRVAFEVRELGMPPAESSRITHPADLLGRLDVDTRELDADAFLDQPLFRDLEPAEKETLRHDPQQLSLLGRIYANDRFSADVGLALLQREPLDLVAIYLSGVDNFSHRMMDHPAAIDRYYEYVDGLLGRYLAAMPADATVFVVSDHGWDYEPGRGWGHTRAPAGILAAAGPGIVAGAIIDPAASILDVAPTLLGLFGLPATEEMPGRVLEEVLTPDARAEVPAMRIASYGRPVPPQSAGTDPRGREWDQETLGRLRALGYFK